MIRHLPLCLLTAATLSWSQEPAPTVPSVALTPEQVANVRKQLTDLEAEIQRQRGGNLSQIIARLSAAAGSDAAALKFYEECQQLVNVERKDLDAEQTRQREAQQERELKRRSEENEKTDGEFGTALRMQLQYLILTLQADDEAKPEVIAPKLQAYIQELVAAAPSLKGRSWAYLNSPLGQNNVFVSALQLRPFLDAKNWSNNPGDIGAMYKMTLLPYYEAKDKDSLPAQWDAQLAAQASLMQGVLPEPEYELWRQTDAPQLQWLRAEDLFARGPNPLQAMADMLKVIRDHPAHPDSQQWLTQLRTMVEAAAGSDTPPGS
ncbi:MAG: hypothetical protein KDK99_05345 [Verrucomicrobiales bacterium]|nr:hypothetical protein [Verrucomicrobiales bacterium]